MQQWDWLTAQKHLKPKGIHAYETTTRCYFFRNMYQEAIAELEKGLAIYPTSPILLSDLARAHARLGNKERAMTILNELKKRDNPVPIAQVYAELNDKESAFEWLEKAYQRRSAWLGALKEDPRFDPLRLDPRFEDLLRRVGLAS